MTGYVGAVPMGVWKHLLAILLLPGIVTIVVPSAIILLTGEIEFGWGLARPYDLLPTLFGCILIGLGFFQKIKTISLFATVGEGTLAPWEPTRMLVVRGPYRYVRNPMISGVLAILLGEALILGSLPLIYWFLLFFLLNAIYIPLVEERDLVHRFGNDYLNYKKNVPRWIPRLKPWNSASDEG